jgi:hypothetical protein
MLLPAKEPQATIQDTGSTNRPGLRVTIDRDGHASVEQHNSETRHVKLREQLCNQFMRDLKEVGSLSALPARHCMKSASFGSRLFIEYNGEQSPDLSCPGSSDPHLDALQKDTQEILQAARDAARIRPGNVITVPAPGPSK